MTRTIAAITTLGLLLAAPAALAAEGDYNGDGVCDAADTQIIQDIQGSVDGDGTYVAAADYDGDGVISLIDLGHHLDLGCAK